MQTILILLSLITTAWNVCNAPPLGCLDCPNNPDVCQSCVNGYRYTTVPATPCQSCPSNCDQCPSDAATCTQCSTSSTYTLYGGQCKLCLIGDCQTCSADNICQTCSNTGNRRTLYNNACFRCDDTNCATCSGLNTCHSCIPNYVKNGVGVCKLCTISDCTRCYDDNKCDTCSNAFRFTIYTDDQCYKCTNTYCTMCSANDTCSSCSSSPRYTLYSGDCKKCTDTNCQTCSADQVCSTCVSASYIIYSGDDKCKLCTTANCLQCSSSNYCISCSTSGTRYIAYGGTCKRCDDPNCVLCSADNVCASCSTSGSRLTLFQGACYSCTDTNCLVCSGSNQCQICVSTSRYTLYPDTKQCKLCTDTNCIMCYDNSKCLTCSTSPTRYTLYSDACVQCSSPRCKNCSSPNQCSTCQTSPTRYTQHSGSCFTCTDVNCTLCTVDNVCFTCAANYIKNANSVCKRCTMTGCDRCSDHDKCDTCTPGTSPRYTLYTDFQCYQCSDSNCLMCSGTETCTSCSASPTRYTVSSGACVQCNDPYCTQCTAANTCSTCKTSPRYVLYGTDGLCKLCTDTNCQGCSADNVCHTCVSASYTLYSGVCRLCSVANCVMCSANDVCLTCSASPTRYTAYGGVCKLCPDTNCDVCAVDGQCKTCVTSSRYVVFVTDKQCKLCTDTNCLMCQSSNVCISCKSSSPRYTVYNGACKLCPDTYCQNCSADSVCNTCDSQHRYTIYNNACKICTDTNCASCTDHNVCSSCVSGYTVYNGACYSCTQDTNCTACFANSKCLTCATGYVLYLNMCYQCPNNCTSCSDHNVCLSCTTGYTLYAGTCYNCPTAMNCQTCYAANKCLTCSATYTADLDACYSCPSSMNCRTCYADNKCRVCLSPYKLFNDSCLSCSLSNCLSCNSDSKCVLCQATYTLYNGTCYACLVSNCLMCYAAGKCLTCQSGYTVYNDACYSCPAASHCAVCIDATPHCDSCVSGYTLYNQLCYSCSSVSNCVTCSANSVCETCVVGYTKSSGSCYSCSAVSNCQTCTANNVCGTCNTNYVINSGACIYCPSATCTNCSASSVCSVCAAGNTLSNGSCYTCSIANCQTCTANGYCGTCTSPYTADLGSCFDCTGVTGCSVCSADGVCKTCVAGKTVSGGSCYSCSIANCVTCNADDTCQTCQTGYEKANNTCFPCGSARCTLCLNCNPNTTNCTGCGPYGILYLYDNMCRSTCPTGTYIDSSTCSCQACTNGCLSCFGTGLTKCNTCANVTGGTPSKYYKVVGQTECTSDCGNFYYPVDQSNQCKPCHQSCKTCTTNATNCQSCRNVTGIIYYFDNTTCVATCPNAYYQDTMNNKCQYCQTACTLCFGAGFSKCTACQNVSTQMYYKRHNQTKCATTCYDGTYADDASFTCKICNSQCKTCDIKSSNCTSCGRVNGIDLFLTSSGTCVSVCLSGYYRNASTGTCDSCPTGCLTCTGNTTNDCQSCNGTAGYYKYIGEDTCATSCPKGQYNNTLQSANKCLQCSSVCQSCSGLADNCTASDGCPTGYFFEPDTNSCRTICPDGKFPNLTDQTCSLCNAGCQLCYKANKCTKCTNTSAAAADFYYKDLYTDSCATSCATGSYEPATGFNCEKCHESCVDCDVTATNCTGCKNVTGIVYYLNQSSCLAKCPDGKYGSAHNNSCEKCHDFCSKCVESTDQNCVSCRINNTIKYYLSFGTTNCVANCPDGQYEEDSTLTCKVCSSNCKTCDVSASNCQSCYMEAGALVFFENYKCVQKCKVKFYGNNTLDPANYTCESCFDGCLTCTGPGNASCQSCTANTTSVKFYKFAHMEVCDVACPAGQFVSATFNYTCEFCSSACVTCEGRADNCTFAGGCRNNQFFYNGTFQCLSVCPNGYYGNSSTGYCEQCASGCALCFGYYAENCTKCTAFLLANGSTSALYKHPQLDRCVADCPTGWYEQSLGYICEKCHESCGSCGDNATDCPGCKNVTGIVYYNLNSSCLSRCPDGYFGRDADNACIKCHDYCSKCFGADNLSCTACRQNNSIDYFLSYGTNTCVQNCPGGQFANTTTLLCLICDSNCQNCSISSKNCTSCYLVNGFYVFLNGNICVQNCPDGQYRNTSTKVCTDCIGGCATCTGPTINECLTCKNNTQNNVVHTYYKIINATTCSKSCPPGQFISASILYDCQACAPQCQACVNTAQQCIITDGCARGFYFYNVTNSCIATCPNGLYADVVTKFCQNCSAGCLTCFGSTTDKCYTCGPDPANSSNTHYKKIMLNECVVNCPDGQYQQTLGGYYCAKCHQACATCLVNATDCDNCTNVTGVVYYRLNNKCLSVCPDGYYGNSTVNQCQTCHDYCATCFAPTNLKCRTCRQNNSINYYLSYGTTECVANCLAGQYKNDTVLKCMVCDSNCKTCDVLATNCTTCYLNNGQFVFWQNYICVQNCADGWYQNLNNFNCTKCADGCYTCNLGPSLCDTCTTFNNQIYYKDRNSKTCALTCPTGQFIKSGTPYLCQACDAQCVGCSGNSSNCNGTLGCAVNYYYHTPTSECLAVCPDGYYADKVTTNSCIQCAAGCSLCYGPGYSACTRCKVAANGTAFYKVRFVDQCVSDCPAGDYQIYTSLQCMKCHDSCVICNTNALDCQQCKNFSGVTYFYHNNQCLITCPRGFWGYKQNNSCQGCRPQCPSCFGNTTSECYQCTLYNSVDYYLQYSTTNCLVECPYGQYQNVTQHKCRLCNINCATCDLESTNCTSCTYVNSINIVYLYNFKCVTFCPTGYWANSTVSLDHQCTRCHTYCTSCTGPSNYECPSCATVTNVGVTTIYYKDLYSSTCNPTCPDGQFISILFPNFCVPCDTKCVLCSTSASHCSKCQFGYYLYVPDSLCTNQCPQGYYNDPTLTANFYYCTICATGCKSCTGPGLNNCQTCNNDTINNVIYYKHQSSTSCVTTCTIGYFGNNSTNKCQPCQGGCVTCFATANYCYSCQNYNGNDYFKVMGANSCVKICPNGTYGEPSTYSCIECPYFSYEGSCLLTCPNDTNVDVTTGRTICKNCSSTENTCEQRYVFNLKTTVSDDGESLVHSVNLPEGLHTSVTQANLAGTVVYLVYKDGRRRMLNTMKPLAIKSIRIQRPKTILVITQNSQIIDFSRTFIQINFPGGAVIAENGVPYSSTTDTFQLNDAEFVGSYYRAFLDVIGPKIMGITFICFGVLFLIIVLSIPQKRTYHQQMAFIMFLQCIGFLRMRGYPILDYVYSTLVGFAQMQMLFIPNVFYDRFPIGYIEDSYNAVKFAWGTHNFIQHMGSCFLVFIPLQVILLIYFAAKGKDPAHYSRYRLFQQFLIQFFMPIVFFNITLSLIGLALNNILSSTEFMISQLIGVLLLFVYLAYLIVWVRKHLIYELYKINNVLRAIFIGIMCINTYAGLIVMIIVQLVFIIIDLRLYRQIKINKKTYVADRILMIGSIFCACLINQFQPMLIALGICVGLLFAIKAYYIIIRLIDFAEERKKRQLSDISVSQVAHKSVKDHSEKQYSSDKQNLNNSQLKINEEVLLYNEKMRPTNKIEKQNPNNRKLIYDMSQEDDSISQKKDVSNQSQGQLVVYLDPQQYQNQSKDIYHEKDIFEYQRSKEKETIVSVESNKMKQKFSRTTAAGFYKRRNNRAHEDSVQVIKVQQNESQIDNDIVSDEKSEGGGWLEQKDERNEQRRRNNKLVWKIMDIENQDKQQQRKSQ